MAWQDILAGALGGMAGDPSFGMRMQQQRMNMQLAMEKLKREAEEYAVEQQYRKSLMKKLEMETANLEQQMQRGQEPVEFGGELGVEPATTPLMGGQAQETELTETGKPKLRLFQTPKQQVPMGALPKETQEKLWNKRLGIGESEKGFTLGPGQVRFEGGKEVARGPEKEIKEPTFESGVEYAGLTWPGGDYTTPEGRKKFFEFVKTPGGQKYLNQKMSERALMVTPPTYVFPQTGTGIVPIQSRGAGAGNIPGDLGAKLPSDAIDRLSTQKNIVDRIGIIETKAANLKDRIGPVEGRWTKLKIKYAKDPQSQEVVNEVRALIRIAYGWSGKQISAREMEILEEAILPRLEQPTENFFATLKTAKEIMATNHNDSLKYYTDSGYSTKIKPLEMKTGKKPVEEQQTEETKTVNGKTYIKKNGKWYEK